MSQLVTPAVFPYQAYRFDTDSRFPDFGFPSLVNANMRYGSGDNVKTRDDDPNWRLKIVKRADAGKPYRLQLNKARTVAISHISTNNATYPSYTTKSHFTQRTIGYTDVLVEPEDLDLRDLALIKLKRKLSQRSSDWNAIAPLVELREMRKLIRSAAQISENFFRKLVATRNELKPRAIPLERKLRRREKAYTYQSAAPTFIEDLSGSWLNFSFGISPTIKDIQTAAATISQTLIDNRDRTYRDKGSAWKVWSTNLRSEGSGSANANVLIDAIAEHRLSYYFGAGRQFGVESANPYEVVTSFGLDFGHIVPAFWELTPYSWLFDYFTTTGAYLEDLFTYPGGNDQFLYETKVYKRQVKSDIRFSNSAPTVFVEQNRGGVATQEYIGMTRTIHTALPHLALRFKTLDESGRNGLNRLLNLGSLLLKR